MEACAVSLEGRGSHGYYIPQGFEAVVEQAEACAVSLSRRKLAPFRGAVWGLGQARQGLTQCVRHACPRQARSRRQPACFVPDRLTGPGAGPQPGGKEKLTGNC